ncbi:MAG: hypothetical protein SGJ18_10645 [Pseudomonadota bacterium]|nr:hypothetical protein [Pseudomonadota bacterium]
MKNNDGRDNELDQLLKPLKSASPNDLQMQKWKSAVQMNNRKSGKVYATSRTKWAFQLVAAMFVGIVIGAVAFKSNNSSILQSHIVAQISLDDATFERSHDNLD